MCGGKMPKSDIRVSLETNTLIGNGQAVRLQSNEAEFLYALWHAEGRVVTKPALMAAVYGSLMDYDPSDKILCVYACRIRRKMAGTGWTIRSIWGRGYALSKISR